MRVYLAPFLHGSRYTSFGRHFTHPDKLREVVERLHPYIDDGDVVRFTRAVLQEAFYVNLRFT